jgi:hypothetical protein
VKTIGTSKAGAADLRPPLRFTSRHDLVENAGFPKWPASLSLRARRSFFKRAMRRASGQRRFVSCAISLSNLR